MMNTPPNLRPATADEVADCLAHALQYNGRKRFRGAEHFQARMTADHLFRALELSGFVLMRKPPAPPHSSTTFGMKVPGRD